MTIARQIIEALLPIALAAWLIAMGQPWFGFAVLTIRAAFLTVAVILWRKAAKIAIEAGQQMIERCGA